MRRSRLFVANQSLGSEFWIVYVLAMSLMLPACAEDMTTPSDDGTADGTEIQKVHQAIKGGQQDTSHPAVVGIVSQQGFSAGICTGTLVAPNLVLTAQHCVSELSSNRVACGQTQFQGTRQAQDILVTTDSSLSRDFRSYRRGETIHVPQGSTQVCGNDIALVVLQSKVPRTEAEPIPPRIDDEIQQGESYSALGYGRTGSGGGEGTRRIIDNRVVRCGTGCSFNGIKDTEFLGNGGTCQGDSGGTALDSQGRVMGALSRGAPECNSSIYSATTQWRSWLVEHAKSAAQSGGYQLPAWAGGSDDPSEIDSDFDGVVDANDNCVETKNTEQNDLDGDGKGDVCDSDTDGDGVDDGSDNCGRTPNPDQTDTDGDFDGDACDNDSDGDGVPDSSDNCPKVSNPRQVPADGVDKGAACTEQTEPDPSDPQDEDSDNDSDGNSEKEDQAEKQSSTEGDASSERSDRSETDSSSNQTSTGPKPVASGPSPVSQSSDGRGCSSAGSRGPVGPAIVLVFLCFGLGLSRTRES